MTRPCPTCGTDVEAPDPTGSSRSIPNIPPATDLASAVAAVNAISQYLRGQFTPTRFASNDTPGNLGGNGGSQFAGSKAGMSKGKKQEQHSRWKEVKRVTKTVKIFNPDDHDQYIVVERINLLVMQDQQTKANWIFSR